MSQAILTHRHSTSVLEPETEVKPFETCSFFWGDYNYLLRRSVQCLSAHQDGLWVFECPEFHLSAFAADRREAWDQFQEGFAFLYDGLMHEPDDALSADARALRDTLRDSLQEVQPVA